MNAQNNILSPLRHYNRKRWVVVGDASRFIVFENRSFRDLNELKRFSNPDALRKISTMTTDQPGRGFARNRHQNTSGVPRHAYTSEQDPKAHSLETTVKRVGEFLDKASGRNEFDELVLVMEGKLSGQLQTI
ncbi:MAG: host attachment protein [Bdellovibrionota bacterium]